MHGDRPRSRIGGIEPVTRKTATESEEKRGGPPGPPDYVPKMGEDCIEAMKWLDTSPPELSRYGGKWVVASGRRVCAAADGPAQAIAEAERSGVSPDDMVVTFVEDVPRVYRTAHRR